MSSPVERLESIQERIRNACGRVGRDPSGVCLVAVSKRFPAVMIEALRAAGQSHFGESRQQEGSEKVALLSSAICWHFIGKLQRNKVRKVIQEFPVIHSVDSLKLALHMDRIAAELGLAPEIYLEVNQAGEERKGGFLEQQLREEFVEIASLSNLKLVGLMIIPPAVDSPEDARPWFARLKNFRDELHETHGRFLPGLSMGMSQDFEVAVEEGATVVRVGSAIFGERPVEG